MICNGCGQLAVLSGTTVRAPIDTWWCMNCYNSGRHRQAQYTRPIQANENNSMSRMMGMASYYDTPEYQASIREASQQPAPYQVTSHSATAHQPAYNQPPPLPARPLNPRFADYTVGWICAVEVEYIAACELLDQEFGPPGDVPTQDDNHYTYGRIGPHNVVMACLPRGTYGLTNAAATAAHMARTFPGLRVRLMVGIGGGAPSARHDIRLGDVVVSTPIRRTGGVIHYEFGRTIQGRQFERTGMLDAPPRFLLNAINALGAHHSRRGHQINETIAAMITRNPRLRRLQQPQSSTDILYRSSLVHADPAASCSGMCSLQSQSIVARRAREEREDDPVIHYGLIASADRLMMDADMRDHLAEEEGVMCFEMEAAGLMDGFHCLVVRGICDYSDTHKNDLWQGYAASTAAAYAKELLQYIPSANTANAQAVV